MSRISVPICNRTNYSKLKPILCGLKKDIDIDIVVSSDMAIYKWANAIPDIISDGMNIDHRIDCLLCNDTLESMTKTVGMSLIEHASYFAKNDTKAILVVGDRFDILPSVLSAKMMNIPILHVQGGERSGSIDDTVRDIISICAERHYVSTQNAYDHVYRIAKNKNVFYVGCPSVEFINGISVGDYLDVSKMKKKYKNSFCIAPNENYILVAVHPNTDNKNDIDMDILLSAVISFGMKTVVLWPNIDAYNSNIMDGVRDYEKNIIRVRHMPLDDFVHIMAHASCMVGNSSAGIREAASFGVPVVNVGNRQNERERNKNTIDASKDYYSIRGAIEKSISIGRYPKENIYYKENCVNSICSDIVDFMSKLSDSNGKVL